MRYDTSKLVLLAGAGLALELTVAGRLEALFLLAMVGALFARDARQGLVAAWIIGLLKDAGSSNPLGFHALLFLGAAWLVLFLRQFLFREHPVTQAAIVFGGVFALECLAAFYVSVFVGGVPFVTILGKALGAALVTALAAPLVVWVMSHVRWLVR